jgi:putative salt-induced outer membrane protein YdiY
MQSLRSFAVVAAFAAAAVAQDRITLNNGDVLTGTVKSLADGKLVITSPALGDVTVPFANVTNIATAGPVDLLTVQGEHLKRRIAGIDGTALKLEGDGPPIGALQLANLSQINPPEVPRPKWTGSLTLGGSVVTGNTERRSIAASFDAVRRSEDDRITVDALWNYAEDKRRDDPATPANESGWTLSDRRAGAGLKYDHFIDKEWYWLVSSRVLGDTLADIELRFTAGAGLGYQVIETDTENLLFEAGLSYFSENYRSNTPTLDYMAARLSYKYSRDLSKTLKLVHGVEAYPSLERAQDVYFTMVTKLQAKVTETMIAQLSWEWDYDNTPAPGHDRSDNRVLLSVGWTF